MTVPIDPPAEGPVVSILVVAYNSADLLAQTLETADAAADGLPYELLVVDNASPDGRTADVVRSTSDRASSPARLVALTENVGFGRAVNLGVQQAGGDFVCLLNPDARPEPGAVSELVAAARRRPRHLLYSGRVVDRDGSVDPGCCSALPSLREYLCFATGMSTIFPRNRWLDPRSLGRWQRQDERVVPAVSGAFLLFRRAEFLAAGGFDPDFFMYSEDTDLSARAHRLGAPPLLVPTAGAVHENGASSSTAAKAQMVLRGKCTYLRKHWPQRKAAAAVALLQAGVALRAAGAAVTGRGGHWTQVWQARSSWRRGWPSLPLDSLVPPGVAEAVSPAQARSCSPAAPSPARP
ncbi:MAG: glycosyltransferase family 2 protein [Motilibacteraceae bacterium]